MALKGKAKRSQRSGGRTVARAPRSSMEKVSPPRPFMRLNAITVLGGLFILTMLTVLIWALVITLRPKPIEGLAEYKDATKDVRTDLENAGSEFVGLVDEVLAGKGDPNAAADAGAARVASLQSAVQTVQSAGATEAVSDARVAHLTCAQALVEAADTLALLRDQGSPELVNALARKVGTQTRLALALLDLGNGVLVALDARKDFKSTPEDVADPPAEDPYAPAAPLDGLGAAGAVPPPKVSLDEQPDSKYGDAAVKVFEAVDAALGNMGQAVVDQFEASGDAEALRQAAIAWAGAIRTAIDQLAATARPETLQASDALLRNALWLYLESVRSFASIASAPDLRDQLLENGKALRLLGDQVRAAAAGTMASEADVKLPPAPSTPFPQDLVLPDEGLGTVPPPADTGAGVPVPEAPAGGQPAPGG